MSILQLYFALNAIYNPSNFSVASIAILQQAATSLRWTFGSIFSYGAALPRTISRIGDMYTALDVKPVLKEGSLSYPGEKDVGSGMALEVR